MQAHEQFGLVSSIVIFLQVGVEVGRFARETYASSSDATFQNRKLDEMVDRFQETVRELEKLCPPGGTRGQQSVFSALAEKCRAISMNLKTLLDSLKAQKSDSMIGIMWQGILKALGLSTGQKIEGLNKELDGCRQEMLLLLSQEPFLQDRDSCDKLIKIAESNQEELARIQKSVDAFTALPRNLPNDFEEVEADVLEKKMEQFVEALDWTIQQVRERRVLNGLKFPFMRDRFDEIKSPHEGTFDWLLSPDTVCPDGNMRQARTSFIQWLCHKRGFFHICGRPGSGKSTLLKYLCTHDRTKKYLGEWARKDGKSLLIGSFFLWKHRSRMQNSWDGLVRGLLHSIASECRDLIPVLFPDEWDLSYIDPGVSFDDSDSLSVFQHLKLPSSIFRKYNLAIFVDGLSENNSDHKEIVDKLVTLVHNNYGVKICLTNRWVARRPPFIGSPTLRLHQLNRNAIKKFVAARLNNNLRLENRVKANSIIDYIADRSLGEFLWVTIVLGITEQNLQAGMSFSRLLNTAQKLPNVYGGLYEKLLRFIPEEDKQEACSLLSMVILGPCQWPLVTFPFLREYVGIRGFADGDKESLSEAQRTIQEYWNGLLLVDNLPPQDTKPTLKSYVTFAHSSVIEFLQRDELAKRKQAARWQVHHAARNKFDPFRALCQIFLTHIKTTRLTSNTYASSGTWQYFLEFGNFEFSVYILAQIAMCRKIEYFPAILTEVARVAQEMLSIDREAADRALLSPLIGCPELSLEELIKLLGALHGFTEHISYHVTYSRRRAEVQVDALCWYLLDTRLFDQYQVFTVLERYYAAGKWTPNKIWGQQNISCWHLFLAKALTLRRPRFLLSCVAFFLLHGGDPRFYVGLDTAGMVFTLHGEARDRYSHDQDSKHSTAASLLRNYFSMEECRTGVSFKSLIPYLFPQKYEVLLPVINWILAHEAPLRWEQQGELEYLFGKSLREITSRPKLFFPFPRR